MIEANSESSPSPGHRKVTFNEGRDVAELRNVHVQMGQKHVFHRIPFIPCEGDLKEQRGTLTHAV